MGLYKIVGSHRCISLFAIMPNLDIRWLLRIIEDGLCHCSDLNHTFLSCSSKGLDGRQARSPPMR
jgi:hypothetical protein